MDTLMNNAGQDGEMGTQEPRAQEANSPQGTRGAEAPLLIGLTPEQVRALGLDQIPSPGQLLDVLGRAVVRNSPGPERVVLELELVGLADPGQCSRPEPGLEQRGEKRGGQDGEGRRSGRGTQEEFFQSLFQGGA
ncbi:MAG: hypothetical protein KKE73_07610 [Proteobacteria bacterium]|nr:hypothetical protein [Pseudomonadota bacterium]